jgi:hypothetical protein
MKTEIDPHGTSGDWLGGVKELLGREAPGPPGKIHDVRVGKLVYRSKGRVGRGHTGIYEHVNFPADRAIPIPTSP